MNTQFVQEMKMSLEQERALLQEELGEVSLADTGDHVPGDRAPKFPEYGSDNLGENTNSPLEVEEYALNSDITGNLSSRLQAVDAALTRAADGTYGVCRDCGGEIHENRLRANPAADTCMNCATGGMMNQ